jgi:hypothetical protein
MKKLLPPLLLLATSVLFFAGCNGFERGITAVGLSVELTGIERTADGTVTVAWKLVNPNISSYLIARTNHKIFLEGKLVGTALNEEPTAVPAQQSVAKVTRLSLADAAAAGLIADAAARGAAAYRVESQLLIRLYGETTDKGALTHSGSVPVTNK